MKSSKSQPDNKMTESLKSTFWRFSAKLNKITLNLWFKFLMKFVTSYCQ
jgi:hypothetical protein